MFYFSKEIVANGDTVVSFMHYIGSTNAPVPLITIPTVATFVKGAAVDVTVTLEVAAIPTLTDQSIQPVDADFIVAKTYNADAICTVPSLNGMWIRFRVVNSSGGNATITCLAE